MRTVADLKGRKIAVTGVGTLTGWVTRELVKSQGWSDSDVTYVTSSNIAASRALLKVGEIDAMTTDMSTTLEQQRKGEERLLFSYGDLVKDFHMQIIFATDKVIAEKPEAVRAFVAAWLETIAFVKANKAKTVEILHQVLGFHPDGIETFEVNLPDARYGDPAARVRFHETFAAALRELPGAASVGATSWLPANGAYHQWGFRPVSLAPGADGVPAMYRVIDGDYFQTIGVPIVRGRAFNDADRADTAGKAVISLSLAKKAFGERDPLGQYFEGGDGRFQVIGVAGDVAMDPNGTQMDFVYLSHAQFAGDRNWTLIYVMRASGDPAALLGPARAALSRLDPALVLFQPRALDDVLAGHRARERFTLLLMGTFAAVALALAAIGLYGVLSYAVTQRVHEIGVRMALGARPGQVLRAVMSHGAFIAAAGGAVGLAGALALGRVLEGTIAGTQPRDPVVFIGVVLVLGTAVAAAGYIPARRATKTEPIEALRQ